MNILIGKLGRAIYFDKSSWSSIGGDIDAPTFYIKLASEFPEHTFIMGSATDYKKLKNKDHIPKNIFFLYDIERKNYVSKSSDPDSSTLYNVLVDGLKKYNIELHAGIIFSGPVGCVNVPKSTNLMKPEPGQEDDYAKCLLMNVNYSAPMIHCLNQTNIPWVSIDCDPRYVPLVARDLVNTQKAGCSQINLDVEKSRSKEFGNQRIRAIDHYKVKYVGIEAIHFVGKQKPNFEELLKKKDVKTTIVLNQGLNNAPDRGPELMKYIRDDMTIDVYGKWNEEYFGKDPRFKGPKPFAELVDTLNRTKYTICIPIDKDWATAKYWEMAYHGILPFLHPRYDTQKNLPVPEFLRLKNEKEFVEKIEILENDRKLYLKILAEVYKSISDSKFYQGTWIVDNVWSTLTDFVPVNNNSYQIPKEDNGLEDFF